MQNYYYEHFTGIYDCKPTRGDESETANLYRNTRLVHRRLDDPNLPAAAVRIPRACNNTVDVTVEFRNYILKAANRAKKPIYGGDNENSLIVRASKDPTWKQQIIDACRGKYADCCDGVPEEDLFDWLQDIACDRRANPIQRSMPFKSRLRLAKGRTRPEVQDSATGQSLPLNPRQHPEYSRAVADQDQWQAYSSRATLAPGWGRGHGSSSSGGRGRGRGRARHYNRPY